MADHMTQTGHRIKWDHFDILATGQSDIHCKIKETLLIRGLKPALVAQNSFQHFPRRIALNFMYRICLSFAKSYNLSCLSKFSNKKKIHRVVFEI